MRKQLLIGAALLVLALAAGVASGLYFAGKKTRFAEPPALAPEAARRLFDSRFPDQHGKEQPLAQWQGRPLVINFWAAWCPPCRDEIPDLARLNNSKNEKSPQIVGISVDIADKSQKVALAAGATYPLLQAGEAGLALLPVLGNTAMALPFTLILDRQGKTVLRKSGRLATEELEAAWLEASAP